MPPPEGRGMTASASRAPVLPRYRGVILTAGAPSPQLRASTALVPAALESAEGMPARAVH